MGDADTGKDLMGYIVQYMRASGRYRGELFDTDDGDREDSERLREMDEVEADYAGCLVRVGYTRRRPRGECSHAGLASSIPELLRGAALAVVIEEGASVAPRGPHAFDKPAHEFFPIVFIGGVDARSFVPLLVVFVDGEGAV